MSKLELIKSLVKSGAKISQIDENIFSFLPENERKSDYDKKALFYDFVIGNEIYNRLIWGNSKKNYEDFYSESLHSTANGIILDAGCGSLVFTANALGETNGNKIILLDRSLGMLKKAEKRLIAKFGEIPGNIVFLQADIFNLPFNAESFDAVISHGMAHVFSETERYFNSLLNVAKSRAPLFFLVLLAENVLGKIFTNFAKLAGEIAIAENSEYWEDLVKRFSQEYRVKTNGNIGYIELIKEK